MYLKCFLGGNSAILLFKKKKIVGFSPTHFSVRLWHSNKVGIHFQSFYITLPTTEKNVSWLSQTVTHNRQNHFLKFLFTSHSARRPKDMTRFMAVRSALFFFTLSKLPEIIMHIKTCLYILMACLSWYPIMTKLSSDSKKCRKLLHLKVKQSKTQCHSVSWGHR